MPLKVGRSLFFDAYDLHPYLQILPFDQFLNRQQEITCLPYNCINRADETKQVTSIPLPQHESLYPVGGDGAIILIRVQLLSELT